MPKPAIWFETVRPEPGGERLTVEDRAGRKGTGRLVAARTVGAERVEIRLRLARSVAQYWTC
jgi:hypothetical protein